MSAVRAAVLVLFLAACGTSEHASPAPPTPPPVPTPAPPTVPPPAPAPALPTGIEVTAACGHVHARLPEGATATETTPCELAELEEPAAIRGALGGSGRLAIHAGPCSFEVQVTESFDGGPQASRSHVSDAPPSSPSFDGSVESGPPSCAAQLRPLLDGLAHTARVEPPGDHAHFTVSSSGAALELDLPGGMLVGFGGTEADVYETAWIVAPRRAPGAFVAVVTAFEDPESGTVSDAPGPPVFRAPLLGRPHAFTAAMLPLDVDSELPCAAANLAVGPRHLVSSVYVCAPDEASRAPLLAVLATLRLAPR